MKKLKVLTFCILFFQLFSLQSYAVKAYPFPISVTQPDGTQLTIRLQGDEFHHFQTTEDGYLLKQDVKGYYTYAALNEDGIIAESKVVARDIVKRKAADVQFLNSIKKASELLQVTNTLNRPSKMKQVSSVSLPQHAYPLNGTPKSLVILVNFSDKSYVVPTPQTAYTSLLNQDGYSTNGGTGSARDYFMSCSYGKFAPNFDVVGPFTLPQTLDYYGKNDVDDYDTNPLQMVIDACAAANSTTDFTQYDTDGDGVIDNVFVYYAGYNEAEGAPANTIWPHRWGVYPQSLFPSDYNYTGTVASVTFDGKRLMDYACTSELKGTSGTSMCGIGTFSHEFGHVLGLPDYYDTSGTQYNTLDEWSIMDAGAYNNSGRTPPTYSCYDRFFLGWLAPQQASAASDITLLPIYQGKTPPANTINQAFLLSAINHNLNGTSPSPAEFFMVEYRKKTGWDAYLPAEGMLVWHIDYNQTAWDNNEPNNYTGSTQTLSSHMRCYLQPLVGSTTTPGTAFTTGNFTPTTWSGTNINRAITSIVKTTDNVTFKLMGGAPVDPNGPAVKVGIVENTMNFSTTKTNIVNTKTINIKTTDLLSNLTLSVTGTNASNFTVSTSTITKDAANAVSGINITVNYLPTTTGTHTATLTISGGGLNPSKVINLQGDGI